MQAVIPICCDNSITASERTVVPAVSYSPVGSQHSTLLAQEMFLDEWIDLA